MSDEKKEVWAVMGDSEDGLCAIYDNPEAALDHAIVYTQAKRENGFIGQLKKNGYLAVYGETLKMEATVTNFDIETEYAGSPWD